MSLTQRWSRSRSERHDCGDGGGEGDVEYVMVVAGVGKVWVPSHVQQVVSLGWSELWIQCC